MQVTGYTYGIALAVSVAILLILSHLALYGILMVISVLLHSLPATM